MRRNRARAYALSGLLALLLLLLSCQPYYGDQAAGTTAAIVGWQCPAPPAPASTAIPAPTPYVRTGTEYFAGQRVGVGDLIVSATATPDGQVAVTVENTANQPAELYLEVGQLGAIRSATGQVTTGSWSATAVTGSPASGQWTGTQTATIRFGIPAGSTPHRWGLPLAGVPGSGTIWWTLQPDPACPDQAGGIDGAIPGGGPAGWPVPSNTAISRGFGCTGFYTGTKAASCPASTPWWHNGIDFANVIGTPLYAVRPATVVFAGQDHGSMDCSWMAGSQPPHTGYGNYSKLKDRQGYTWLYAHQSQLLVRTNQAVAAGSEIGKMGSSGCATGSHTHLSVIAPSGLDVDPLPLLSRP